MRMFAKTFCIFLLLFVIETTSIMRFNRILSGASSHLTRLTGSSGSQSAVPKNRFFSTNQKPLENSPPLSDAIENALNVSRSKTPTGETTKILSDEERLLLGPRQYESYSRDWWVEWAIVFTVFGITGSTMSMWTRYFIKDIIGVQGSFTEGPWSYRLSYLLCSMPFYSCILVMVGTLFGRQVYFFNFARKMWSRFIPSLRK